MDLFEAVNDGNLELVTSLLNKGANPNVTDEDYGDFPLHVASSYGHLGIVNVLLSAGADPNVVGKEGQTALYYASSKGYLDVVNTLLEAGADINLVDIDGNSHIHLASKNGHLDVVKTLLKAGVDPNIKDKNGITPLHTASSYGHLGVVNVLLKFGANPNVKIGSKTPVIVAYRKGYDDIVDVLLKAGAKFDPEKEEKRMNINIRIYSYGFDNLGSVGKTNEWNNVPTTSLENFLDRVYTNKINDHHFDHLKTNKYVIGDKDGIIDTAYLFLGVYSHGDSFNINYIGIPKSRRNEGLFSNFIINLENVADENGLTISFNDVVGPKLKKILSDLKTYSHTKEGDIDIFTRKPGSGIYGYMIEEFKRKKIRRHRENV